MKIITENKVYVQKNDIAYLNRTDMPIPASIFMKVFGQGVVIIDDRNRYEFVEFTEPEEIKFFKKQDWIIDYNEVKDLSETELIELGQNMTKKSNEIVEKYNSMTQKERRKNREMVVLYELLWYKIHSLKDLLLYKKGKLKMTMPTEVSQTVIERKNNIPRLIRSIFTRRKRK